MTRTEPGEGRAGRGGRGMNFTFNISIRAEERSDCPKVRSSNFAPTFPEYFVVIVISVAYKLLTSTAHRQSINVKHCSPGTF